jgi:hypothetical protein
MARTDSVKKTCKSSKEIPAEASLALSSKAKMLTLSEVNKFIANRRIEKLLIKDDRVIIKLTDGRSSVVAIPGESPKVKLKRDGSTMTARELEELNYQLETVLKKMKKSIPQECKPCSITMEIEDLL